MPSKSPAQKKLMQAAAHNKEFAKKVGVPQKVAKEFVAADKKKITRDENDTEIIPASLDYGKLTPALVKAIQELHALVQAQQEEINTLKGGN